MAENDSHSSASKGASLPPDDGTEETLDRALGLLHEHLIQKFRDDLDTEEVAIVSEEISARLAARVEGELREQISDSLNRVERDVAKEVNAKLKAAEREKDKSEDFLRFNIHMRIQHMMMLTSVFIVIFTGMPLKFPDFFVSEALMRLFGGPGGAAIVHRVGALIMIGSALYHTVYTVVSKDGRRDFLALLPSLKDLFDVIAQMRLYFGLTHEHPKYGRFGYIEKFDYWAVYWGCVIMIGSGSILWGQEIALRVLPLYFMNIAKEMHSDEALLATLAIVIWHFYNVHFNPSTFPGSLTWWHGRISKQQMMSHHVLEFERLERAKAEAAGARPGGEG